MFRVLNKFNNNQILFKSILNNKTKTPTKLNCYKNNNKIVPSPISDNNNKFNINIKNKFKQQLNYYSTTKTTITDLPPQSPSSKSNETTGIDKFQDEMKKMISNYLNLINYHQIENLPANTYIGLFMSMNLIGIKTIKLLNGEEMDLKQILIKEIEISQDKHFLAWLELGKLLNFNDEYVTIPIGGKTTDKTLTNFNKIEIFVKCFEMDPTIKELLNEISFFLNHRSIPAIRLPTTGEIKTLRDFCILNYQLHKSINPDSWINLSANLGINEQIEIDGEIVDSTLLLIKGVLLFPKETRFYYEIATKKLKNNEFPISKFRSFQFDHPFTNKNRLQLLVNAIEIEESKSNPKINILSDYYYSLGTFTSNKESTVTINGTEWTKLKCFTKSLVIDPSLLINQFELAKTMTPNETVLINGKSLLKRDVLLNLLHNSKVFGSTRFNQFIYKTLSTLEGIDQELKRNYELLLLKENRIQLELIINQIEINSRDAISLDDLSNLYKQLYLLVTNDQGYFDKPIDNVIINGKKHNKIDLLLHALAFNHKSIDIFYYLSQELQLINDNQITGTEIKSEKQSIEESNLSIKILSGQEFTKLKLIELELNNNLSSSLAYHSYASLMSDTKEKSSAKLTAFLLSISFDENNSKSYFEIGKLLSIHSITSIDISGINYSRKQIFIKSLETEDQSSKLNGKNLLTLFYLIKEQEQQSMESILYNGKTGNEIKNEIILNLKQELSTLTIDKNINKQKLLNLL